MGHAVSIKAIGADVAPIHELWARFGTLEIAPSMTALGYPPHITLAVYDRACEEILRSALRQVFGSRPRIRPRFCRLAYFEVPRLVFWAAPDPSAPLFEAHAQFHRALGASLSRERYRPDT
jgi:hypothetical protein